MSSVSMTYYKYRAGGNNSWNTDVANLTGPYVYGYTTGSVLYGTLYRLSVTVPSGYTLTRLAFNIPRMRALNNSGSTNLYAVVYNHDPSDEFIGANASSNYSWRGYASVSVSSSGPDNTKVYVNTSIPSTGTYYVFFSATDGGSIQPYFNLTLQSTQLSCSATDTKNATPATNVTVSSSMVMNSSTSISWTPFTSGYTYKLTYKFTGQSSETTIVSSTSSSSYSWTPPVSLGNNIPNSDSGTLTIYVYSYEGGSQIGSKCSGSFSLTIPSSGRSPICASGWASASYTAVANHCVAGYSSINVTLDSTKVSGAYGATISSIVATCNSQSATTSGSLGKALQGNNVVSVVATDSRGYTTTYSQTIVGEAYSPPSFDSLLLIRCNSSGTEDQSGTYYAVTPSVNYTAYSGDNSLTIKTRWKVVDGTYSSPVTISNNVKSSAQGGGNISTSYSYIVEVSAYDAVITSSNPTVLTRRLANSTVDATLNLRSTGLGAAFFGLSTADNELQVYGNVKITNSGKLILDSSMYGTTDPSTSGAVIGQIYLKLID